MSLIGDNLRIVREKIGEAAKRSGRDIHSIKLVAVSKNKTADEIAQAYVHGQRCFGENYAQELKEKYEYLKNSGLDVDVGKIEWHFIGHLQKNKAKYVAPIVSCIESIDSFELALAIDRRLERRTDCLIEVNLGQENSKSGALQSEVESLAGKLADLQNLRLKGLMIIPPWSPNPDDSRPYFQKLKKILLDINTKKVTKEPLTELSMGMSHDFEAAIEEGATIVRIGTAVFGERER